jgi:hypothetical protein
MLRIYKQQFDIKKLNLDLHTIITLCKFENSSYKHSVPVMTEEMCPDTHKGFHNNWPFYSHSMDTIPYIHFIWKMFNDISNVTGFRIMRKLPHTVYGIHNDTDAGTIIRLQIPIETNDDCWLAYTELDEIEEGWTEDNSYFKKDSIHQFFNDSLEVQEHRKPLRLQQEYRSNTVDQERLIKDSVQFKNNKKQKASELIEELEKTIEEIVEC